MSDRSIDVVVAGHICLDVFPGFRSNPQTDVSVSEFLHPGTLTEMGPVTLSTGGPVSNTGINLLTLGMKVELMGKVGDDFFATGLLDLLKQRGLEKSMVRVSGEQTSYTIVLAPPGIDRMFLHCPGANDTFGADDVNYETVSRARLFHLGYPPVMRRLYRQSGVELATIYRRVKELRGVTTSLDMALPDPSAESGQVDWVRLLEHTLPYVDVFVPSVEEILFMLDRKAFLARRDRAAASGGGFLDSLTGDDLSRLGDRLLEMGVKIALVKCGERGLYGRTASCEAIASVPLLQDASRAGDWGGKELWRAPFVVERVVSATGSGDAAIAGFLASLLRGLSLEAAMETANAVGACNVTALDALSGVKSWEETQAKIQSGWPCHSITIQGHGWKPVVDRTVWSGPRHG